jgi:hypothetical protein
MPLRGRPTLRAWAATIVLVVGLAVLASLSGPLFPFEPAPSHVADAVAAAPDLDRYLQEREAQHPGIKPDQAKTIVWQDPVPHRKTQLARLSTRIFRQPPRHLAGG